MDKQPSNWIEGMSMEIKEKRKNVHAFAIAKHVYPISSHRVTALMDKRSYRSATYNPYLYDSFVDVDTKQRIKNSRSAVLHNKKISYIQS